MDLLEGVLQADTRIESRDSDKLADSLRLCQRELAQLREEQEGWLERLKRVRRNKVRFQEQAELLSEVLSERLARDYWREQTSITARVSKRLGVAGKGVTEPEQVRMLEASPLFQGPWYLMNNPEVARSGMHPALHYLREGAAKGLDPSTKFSTDDYLEKHPGVSREGLNPLVHHLLERDARRRRRAAGKKR